MVMRGEVAQSNITVRIDSFATRNTSPSGGSRSSFNEFLVCKIVVKIGEHLRSARGAKEKMCGLSILDARVDDLQLDRCTAQCRTLANQPPKLKIAWAER